MKNKIITILPFLGCIFTNAMINVTVAKVSGEGPICQMPAGASIADLKEKIKQQTGFVSTNILKETEDLDPETKLEDVASGETHMRLTALHSDPLDDLKTILREKAGYTIIDHHNDDDEYFSQLSLVLEMGHDPIGISIEYSIGEGNKEKIIAGLLSAMQDFNPSVSYKKTEKWHLDGWSYDTWQSRAGGMFIPAMFTKVGHNGMSMLLTIPNRFIGYTKEQEAKARNFSEFILEVASKKMLRQLEQV